MRIYMRSFQEETIYSYSVELRDFNKLWIWWSVKNI